MTNKLDDILETSELQDFQNYIKLLTAQDRRFFLRNDIVFYFRKYCDTQDKSSGFRERSSMYRFLKRVQELFVHDNRIALQHRYDIARYRYYMLRLDGAYMEQIDVQVYLDLKDRYTLNSSTHGTRLELDFKPFYDYSPSIRDTRTIGSGIRFLNRYMCSNIFSNPEQWNRKLFEFIKLHRHNGQQLLVNGNLITG